MNIKRCVVRGEFPIITDDCGIGDVECPNKCPNEKLFKKFYDCDGLIIAQMSLTHFSGKFNRSKKQAILNWNEAQIRKWSPIYESIHP